MSIKLSSSLPMSYWIKYIYRVIAVLMVIGLTSVLILNNRQSLDKPDKLLVHNNIQTLQLPPPPPPIEITEQLQSAPKLDVRIAGQGAQLKLSKLNITNTKPRLSMSKTRLSAPSFSDKTINFDTSSFGLADLDALPRLLTPLQIKFTPDMNRKGVKKFIAKLHIQIDQLGQVIFKSIKENPYPQLNQALIGLARSAKFTPPKRHGQPVKAEFIWPIALKESL